MEWKVWKPYQYVPKLIFKKKNRKKMNPENGLPVYSGPVDHLRYGLGTTTSLISQALILFIRLFLVAQEFDLLIHSFTFSFNHFFSYGR